MCGDTTGDCGIFPSGLLACHTHIDRHQDPHHPDWEYIKPDKTGTWGIFAPRREKQTQQGRDIWLENARKRKAQREREKLDRAKTALGIDDLDKWLRILSAEMGLTDGDRQRLKDRGLTDEQIAAGLFFSYRAGQKVSGQIPRNLPGIRKGRLAGKHSGIACPAFDGNGRVIGYQIRLTKKVVTGGKYRWGYGQVSSHLPNGELPLNVVKRTDPTNPHIHLPEGILKPYVASCRLNINCIGAAGGNHAGSPEQLKAAIDELLTDDPEQFIVIVPDAGAVLNENVLRQYENTAKLISDWGYGDRLRFASWDQVNKSDQDIDEIDGDRQINYITPTDFKKIAQRQKNWQDWKKYQSLLTAKKVIKHGQTITKTVINQPDMSGVELFVAGRSVGVKGGMGLGKTHEMVKQCQQLNGLIIPGYRNSLGRQTANKINNHVGKAEMVQMAEFCYQDILDNTMLHLCLDSIPKLVEMLGRMMAYHRQSLEEYVSDKFIFIDELMSVIIHLFFSGTLTGKRIEGLMGFITMLRNCKGLAYADANLADWAVELMAYWSQKDQDIIINTHNNISAKLTFLEGTIEGERVKKHDNHGFLLEMKECLDNGQPIAVCSDSQTFIESCEEYLLTFCPNAKIKRIDAKTASESESKRLMEDPDQWLRDNPGYSLLYNTSAESGIDISIRDYFAGHWGFYFGVINCNSFLQLMGRIRDQNVPRSVWVRTFFIASNDDQVSFSAEVYEHYERQGLILESKLLMDAESVNRIQLIHQNSFPVESGAALQARAILNYERRNLRECALACFEKSGYQITKATMVRTDEIKAAKGSFKIAKETVKVQNITDIATASSKYVGKPLIRLSMDSNYADQCAIKKAQWCDRLPGLLNPDDMDSELLRLAIYDAPRLISGMEKLVLVNNPELLRVIGKARLDKILERNAAIPWAKNNQYLECRLLSAIGIGALVETFISEGGLSRDDEIVVNLHSKMKGVISIDGVKGRGSHFLKRSIPQDPIKLASLMLSKVGIPHNVKNGAITWNAKLMGRILPYREAIEASIKERFQAMVDRISAKSVPVTPVTVFAVTPNSTQSHTERDLNQHKKLDILYKSPSPEKTANVLSFDYEQIKTTREITWDEFISINNTQIAQLGWDGGQASQVLRERYGQKSRLKLSDAQIFDWINHCDELLSPTSKNVG